MEFVSNHKPWLLPFDITRFGTIIECQQTLPTTIEVSESQYKLVGITMHHGSEHSGHFTALLKWRESWLLYDGVRGPNMVPFTQQQLTHRRPQMALYFLNPQINFTDVVID